MRRRVQRSAAAAAVNSNWRRSGGWSLLLFRLRHSAAVLACGTAQRAANEMATGFGFQSDTPPSTVIMKEALLKQK